jgi:hypothetical protein
VKANAARLAAMLSARGRRLTERRRCAALGLKPRIQTVRRRASMMPSMAVGAESSTSGR